MITESMMYWITRLDGLNTLFCVINTVSGMAIFALGIIIFAFIMEHDDVPKMLRRCAIWSAVACFMSSLALVFVPTTKEMAMIYTVPAITRSDFVQKDLPDLYDMGIKALKEQLTTTDKDK